MITLMNACTMFAWWGFNLWLPAYLSLPAGAGRHRHGLRRTMSALVIFMQAGMWLGYITLRLHQRPARPQAVLCWISWSPLPPSCCSMPGRGSLWSFSPSGPFVAFFGTGYFTGFGALTAEIYPTSVRATAQGITYNTGRIVSAAGAVRRGFAGPDEGIRILVRDDRRGLSRSRSTLGGHPRNKGPGARVTPGRA